MTHDSGTVDAAGAPAPDSPAAGRDGAAAPAGTGGSGGNGGNGATPTGGTGGGTAKDAGAAPPDAAPHPTTDAKVETTTYMPCAPAPAKCRINPVGDSITQGELGHFVPWPQLMQKSLEADKKSFVYVGSGYGYCCFTSGGGLAARQLVTSAPADAKKFSAQVIIVSLGTNDLIGVHSKDEVQPRFEAGLKMLIDSYVEMLPDALVVATSLPISASADFDDTIHPVWNQLVADHVHELAAKGKHTLYVDIASGMNRATDIYSGPHPTTSGSQAIANAIYATIKPVIPPP